MKLFNLKRGHSEKLLTLALGPFHAISKDFSSNYEPYGANGDFRRMGTQFVIRDLSMLQIETLKKCKEIKEVRASVQFYPEILTLIARGSEGQFTYWWEKDHLVIWIEGGLS